MTEYKPQDFLKCPNCHRTGTVRYVVHADGDSTFECVACDSVAFGKKLHQHDREYTKEGVDSY